MVSGWRMSQLPPTFYAVARAVLWQDAGEEAASQDDAKEEDQEKHLDDFAPPTDEVSQNYSCLQSPPASHHSRHVQLQCCPDPALTVKGETLIRQIKSAIEESEEGGLSLQLLARYIDLLKETERDVRLFKLLENVENCMEIVEDIKVKVKRVEQLNNAPDDPESPHMRVAMGSPRPAKRHEPDSSSWWASLTRSATQFAKTEVLRIGLKDRVCDNASWLFGCVKQLPLSATSWAKAGFREVYERCPSVSISMGKGKKESVDIKEQETIDSLNRTFDPELQLSLYDVITDLKQPLPVSTPRQEIDFSGLVEVQERSSENNKERQTAHNLQDFTERQNEQVYLHAGKNDIEVRMQRNYMTNNERQIEVETKSKCITNNDEEVDESLEPDDTAMFDYEDNVEDVEHQTPVSVVHTSLEVEQTDEAVELLKDVLGEAGENLEDNYWRESLLQLQSQFSKVFGGGWEVVYGGQEIPRNIRKLYIDVGISVLDDVTECTQPASWHLVQESSPRTAVRMSQHVCVRVADQVVLIYRNNTLNHPVEVTDRCVMVRDSQLSTDLEWFLVRAARAAAELYKVDENFSISQFLSQRLTSATSEPWQCVIGPGIQEATVLNNSSQILLTVGHHDILMWQTTDM